MQDIIQALEAKRAVARQGARLRDPLVLFFIFSSQLTFQTGGCLRSQTPPLGWGHGKRFHAQSPVCTRVHPEQKRKAIRNGHGRVEGRRCDEAAGCT